MVGFLDFELKLNEFYSYLSQLFWQFQAMNESQKWNHGGVNLNYEWILGHNSWLNFLSSFTGEKWCGFGKANLGSVSFDSKFKK